MGLGGACVSKSPAFSTARPYQLIWRWTLGVPRKNRSDDVMAITSARAPTVAAQND